MTLGDHNLSNADRSLIRFWLQPENAPRYHVDLTEFWTGGTRQNVAAQAKKEWAGDFTGRPELALEISRWLKDRTPNRFTGRGIISVARHLFRFLDHVDPHHLIKSSGDLSDYHGVEIRRWLNNGGRTSAYRPMKSLVHSIRTRAGHPELFWPIGRRAPMAHKDDVDIDGVKRLYRALKKEGISIKGMFREGEHLALVGVDPRGRPGHQGSAAWGKRENHSWLIKQLTTFRLLTFDEILSSGGSGLHRSRHKCLGPNCTAPGMSSRGSEGIVGKLRWFHPSLNDTAVFLWLFLIGTGWNLSTALAVDLSEEWSEPHPLKQGYRIIHAYKRRSARHQFAVSREAPEWHPYQILLYMKERTCVLRNTVQMRLNEAIAQSGLTPSDEQLAKIERLRSQLKSPWLYHVINKIGEVSTLIEEDCGPLNKIIKAVIDSHNLAANHPYLQTMSTSEARDAWLGHVYTRTGHNIVLTHLASQHADLGPLKYYLRRHKYRAQSEKLLRSVQFTMFEEMHKRGKLDPTRLRILVENGEITEVQEQRLLEHRKRTRLGMGCIEPEKPPREIAPAHRQGSLCQVQRCTGCSHGIVFEESLQPLAKARAELIYLKKTMPLSAWLGS